MSRRRGATGRARVGLVSTLLFAGLGCEPMRSEVTTPARTLRSGEEMVLVATYLLRGAALREGEPEPVTSIWMEGAPQNGDTGTRSELRATLWYRDEAGDEVDVLLTGGPIPVKPEGTFSLSSDIEDAGLYEGCVEGAPEEACSEELRLHLALESANGAGEILVVGGAALSSHHVQPDDMVVEARLGEATATASGR